MGLFLGLLKSWTRVTSFIGKEVTEVVRRPGALFSLVLGPFLIMALFGLGYNGKPRPLITTIVLPAGSTLPTDPATYQQYAGAGVTVAQVTTDLQAARAQLERQQIDLIVVVPDNVDQQFLSGQQSVIRIEYDQTDPVRDNYARFIAYRQVQELNRAIVETAVAAFARCWSSWSCGTRATAAPRISPGACSAAWSSPAPWCTSRLCCSWTSQRQG
jgi:ABC-2 type transport system permease protein